MKSQDKYVRKSGVTPAVAGRLILLLIFVLITSTMMTACNQGIGDHTEAVDEEELDAQQADELAIVEAEGRAQGVIETEARVVAEETAYTRGFSEREDFVGTFIGKWLVEGQPAREVILFLRDDDTAQMSLQMVTDPSEATDESGTWAFESAGVAAITLDQSGHLKLHFDEGLVLTGGEFGAEGTPMLLYNPQ